MTMSSTVSHFWCRNYEIEYIDAISLISAPYKKEEEEEEEEEKEEEGKEKKEEEGE